MTAPKKLILVIGATGAQGSHVVDSLLQLAANGSPSPYTVRAFTRNAKGKRAEGLAAKGAELYEGSFMDFATVLAALDGVYGVFACTDGFTVGDAKETYAGMRIFEMAKHAARQKGVLKHFIWSSTPYSTALGGYDPMYNAAHNDSKARVTAWLKSQPSEEHGLAWTSLSMGIYMDMLKLYMIGPMNVRADGTRVFANPLNEGPIAVIALEDLGFWVRYSLDNRALSSGKDFQIASDWVSYHTLPEIFTRATGLPAIYKPLSIDEWFSYFTNHDKPLANERAELDGPGDVSWVQNFTCWWHWWRDSSKLWPVDMEWIRSVHPGSLTVEAFFRKEVENGWKGRLDPSVLKNAEDGKGANANWAKMAKL